MRARGIACVCLALLVTVALVATCLPAAAADRSKGDFWSYDMSMGIEGMGVEGTVKMTVDDTREITVEGTAYEVNVMTITGELIGSMELMGMSMDLEVYMDGVIYESVDGLAMVKEEMMMDMTAEISYLGFSFSTTMVEEMVTTYSPPSMTGFDMDASEPGDSWTETYWENTTSTRWENGTSLGEDEYGGLVTVHIEIDPSTQTVTVPAGTFDTMKITVTTDGEFGSEVSYWNDEVGYFVKQEFYELDDSVPSTTLELTDYGKGSPCIMTIIIVVALVAVIVAVVIMAVILIRRGRVPPTPAQPGVPPPVPPPPPPPGT